MNAIVTAAVQPAIPDTMFVRDLTAVSEPRKHEMIVNGLRQTFEFHPGKPLEMPRESAVKFLRTPEAFRLTDAQGNPKSWKGVPKQPGQLQAGERFRLLPEQTVANLDELTDQALWMRCAELPGGETVATERDEMIAFIVAATVDRRKANSENDREDDEFVPDADVDMMDAA